MRKDQREALRVDLFTKQLVNALQEALSENGKKASKSDVYSKAVYRLAKEMLLEEKFKEFLIAYNDIERS